MNCRKVQKLLSISLDGELDGPRKEAGPRNEAVNRHVEKCDECRAFKGNIASLAQDFDELAACEPRPGFAQRTLARLPEDAPKAGRLVWLRDALQPTPTVAAAASLALGVFLAWSMNGYASTEEQDEATLIAAEFFDATPLDSFSETFLELMSETE